MDILGMILEDCVGSKPYWLELEAKRAARKNQCDYYKCEVCGCYHLYNVKEHKRNRKKQFGLFGG